MILGSFSYAGVSYDLQFNLKADRLLHFEFEGIRYTADPDLLHSDEGECFPRLSSKMIGMAEYVNAVRHYYHLLAYHLKVSDKVRHVLQMTANRGLQRKALSSNDHRDLMMKNPFEENAMTSSARLREIYDEMDWVPVIDICSDAMGTNSCCPLFYSAYQNGLEQQHHLLGKRILCNPPYSKAGEFIDHLEDLVKNDGNTRVLLIVPKREPNTWMAKLRPPTLWRLVKAWPKGSLIFTKPKSLDVYDF